MSESPPDVDMTFSVWTHQCESPWPGVFQCRDVHLAGPASLVAVNFFVSSYDGFVFPRQRLEIRHGCAGPVWDNGIAVPCAVRQAPQDRAARHT